MPQKGGKVMSPYTVERQCCPLCDSEKLLTLYDIDYEDPNLKHFLSEFYNAQGMIEFQYLEGARYTKLKCQECGFLFQREIPGGFLAERLYEHWISPESAYKIELSKWDIGQFWNFASDFTKVLLHFHRPTSEINVFDFGMGWGTSLNILKSMGCKVYGNEIAPSRVKYAQANGIKNLDDNELQSMTFDYIHAYQVFEHINDPRQALKKLVRLLNDDGLIRISVPNGNGMEKLVPTITWNETGKMRRRLSTIDPLEHINCFSYKNLIDLGELCGLEPVKINLPLKYQTIYQFFRSTIRRPYRFIKYREVGKLPDIIFRKMKSSVAFSP
jgi:SAM-dependent methyltransferase